MLSVQSLTLGMGKAAAGGLLNNASVQILPLGRGGED